MTAGMQIGDNSAGSIILTHLLYWMLSNPESLLELEVDLCLVHSALRFEGYVLEWLMTL